MAVYGGRRGVTRSIVSTATKVQNDMVWIRVVLTGGYCVYASPKYPHWPLFCSIHRFRDMNLGLLSLTYTDVKQHQVLNEFYSMYVGVDSFLWRCDVGNKFINLHKRMLKIRERKLEAQKLRRRKKIDEVLANSDALRDFYLGLECLDSSSDEALKQAMLGVIRSVCTPREAFAIEEYIWGAEATYKSVGELMGITRERVRQIIMKGERRLRVPPNARVLLESASSVISLPSELYDGGLTEYDEFPYFKKGGEEDGS